MDWYEKKLEIDGKTYDLNHLSPFSLNVDLPPQRDKQAISFTLKIRFSTHCVSEDRVDHPTVSFPDEGGKNRFFSFARYDLSLRLPLLLGELPERQCYFASSRNFLTVEITEGDGESKNYHIYFSVKKISEGVSVLVESAYVPNNPERRSKKIRGKVILSNTYHGKRITRSR
ncbi:MAG: hypothetical protein WBB23_01540 [Desulforhopalus sp.]